MFKILISYNIIIIHKTIADHLKAKSRSWKSEILKKEFESGAKFGLGVYQLYLSILPPKVLKILEWVGFKRGLIKNETSTQIR